MLSTTTFAWATWAMPRNYSCNRWPSTIGAESYPKTMKSLTSRSAVYFLMRKGIQIVPYQSMTSCAIKHKSSQAAAELAASRITSWTRVDASRWTVVFTAMLIIVTAWTLEATATGIRKWSRIVILVIRKGCTGTATLITRCTVWCNPDRSTIWVARVIWWTNTAVSSVSLASTIAKNAL